MRIVILVVLIAAMFGFQQIGLSATVSIHGRAALVIGFLLLAGLLAGELLAPLGLPRITGYLLAGIAFGPSVLGVVERDVIDHLALIDELALCLIALTAGGEMGLARMRTRARSILSITAIQTVIVFFAMTGTLWAFYGFLPLEGESGTMRALGMAAVLGVVATANSPATTVAIIVETRARGVMTDTVLGVTMLKDIVVLVVASLLFATLTPILAPGQFVGGGFGATLVDVGMSLLTGTGIGAAMIAYLRYVGRERVVFVLTAALLLITISHAAHLHTLLVAMMAGFTIANASQHAKVFLHGLERVATPVFVVFFCLAGATLDLRALVTLWPVALAYVIARIALLWLGTYAATLWDDSSNVRRFAWTGFVGQAGVSLGLAALVRQTFPTIGGPVADLIIAAILLNQIVGPIVFRRSLIKSGEGQSL